MKQNPSGKNLETAFNVTVLRLGHRLVRDERTSTHIGLVSRAFGTKRLILTGADDHTVESIRKIGSQWGGNFDVKYTKNWRELVNSFEGIKVHLTMYGGRLDESLDKIRAEAKARSQTNLLLVVGAEKVPREIYTLADYNVSVGNQPHSEVAALAVFLDRLFMGEELYDQFVKAKIRISPSSKGKKVEKIIES